MRRRLSLGSGVLLGYISLCACGGSGNAQPSGSAGTFSGALPTTISGIVPATGSVTMLSGGSMLGSTILSTSPTAILTLPSAATPPAIEQDGALSTAAIEISETVGSGTTAFVRAIAPALVPSMLRDRETRIPDAPVGVRVTRQLRTLGRRANGRATAVRYAQSFALGSRHTFVLQGGTIDGSEADPAPIEMPATLVARSAHANVWLDDAVNADPARMRREFPSGASDFATVATDLETAFTIETQAFGPAYTTGIVNFDECDSHGNPLAQPVPRPDTTGRTDAHINIAITDGLAGSGEGGYFYGLDMLDQAEANCVDGARKPAVNGLPLLVIESDNYPPYSGDAADTYPANDETYWLTGDMPQTIAHELQHYLHFVNKYLQQHVDHPADADAGTLDDAFIDEGCSVLAQDLVAGRAVALRESPAFVRAFLLEPADFSLTSFSGFQPDARDSTSADPPYAFYRNTIGNYGYAYLFMRYLYDRFGPQALKAIYAETNFGAVRQPDTGPASAAARGEPFAQLFREFTTALAVHSGGTQTEVSSDPAYRFDPSVILRGAVQTYSRRLPPLSVRTIVQPGPLNPEIFAGNVPTGFAALAAGASANVSLIAGGAVFVTPHGPWTLGATLIARGPVGGGGSLGQGALPTPAPASY